MSEGGAPIEWDFTLLPFARIVLGLLDAVGAKSVIEVGADRGDFTAELLRWAKGSGAKITAIDPEPATELAELESRHGELNLVREPSPEALRDVPLADAIILDGDHNYWTLSGELRLIAERSGEGLPLLLLHDLGWPHSRRDTYYDPERVPEEHRQPMARDAMVAPGEPGTVAAGVGFEWVAEREGGPCNGVLTAVEDFMESRSGLSLAQVPSFFGLGVLWVESAPWADAVAALIEPWDGNPMLERLEEMRLAQVVDRTRLVWQEEQLRAMLNSRAFTIGEGIARVRGRGSPPFSREKIRRALGESR
jgi:Methyltransferase domain